MSVDVPASPIERSDDDRANTFPDFYRANYRVILRTLMNVGATFDEAEDSAQAALERLYRDWGQVRSPLAWTRKTALRHHTGRRQRDRKGHVKAELSARTRFRADDLDLDEREVVVDALRSLPPAQLEIMALHFDGYATEEIADLLGKRQNTVRSNLRAARARLAEFITTTSEVNMDRGSK